MRRGILSFFLGIVASIVFCASSFATVYFGDFASNGFVQGYFFPPHNEYDPNVTIPFAQRIVARYGLQTYATLSDTKFLPNLYGFVDAFSLFGRSHPQISYNYRADPIVSIVAGGLGYHVSKHMDVGLESGRYINLGGYQLNESQVWSAVTVKWSW